MEIIKELNDNSLVIKVIGELNSFTAPELEAVIKNDLANVKDLCFDFQKLDYLSSAGLRVLLVAQKIMSKQGKMSLRHVNNSVMEIFEITGFINVLDIID
jgi:anti-sigma B factor antagonist